MPSTSVRLDTDRYQRLRARAAGSHRPLSFELALAVDAWLEADKAKDPPQRAPFGRQRLEGRPPPQPTTDGDGKCLHPINRRIDKMCGACGGPAK